ncbi:MAG: polymer-forming cytoskeletal protein [Hyphomonadaceae bacterium]
MSETSGRDFSGAVQNVRRTAAQSVTLLRAATGKSTGAGAAMVETGASRPPPTVISANTELKGALTTKDELHIHGIIEGNVRAAAITVCTGGIVRGDLFAETIVIDGVVEGGRIEGQHVLLRAGANVSGEITHGSLGIDTAATFEGAIKRVATPATIAAE